MVAELERSAGGIIFRIEKGEIKYLLLHYKYKSEYYGFARGNIEEDESEIEAAKREIEEETGIKELEFAEGFKEKQKLFYRREGKLIYKEIILFLAETKEKEIKVTEHIGFIWADYEEAIKLLKFKNDKMLLEKANEFLIKMEKGSLKRFL